MFGIPTPMIIGVVLLFLWYVYLFTDTIGARILRMLAELEDEGFKHFQNMFAVFFPVNGLLTILMGVVELARPYGWFEKEGLLKELLTVVFYLLVFIGYPLSLPGKRFRPQWLYPEYHEAARAERKKGAEMMKSQTIPAPAPPPAPAPDPLDIEDLDPFSMEARQARRLESLRQYKWRQAESARATWLERITRGSGAWGAEDTGDTGATRAKGRVSSWFRGRRSATGSGSSSVPGSSSSVQPSAVEIMPTKWD